MTMVEKEQFWTQIVENPSLWGTIQTSDKSFNTQAENIWTVMNETFIKNGSLKEVNRWELMLGDGLDGGGEGTLNERKSRILKRITEYPPVSIKILEGLIKEITDDNYIFDYNKKENKLTLEFYKGFENDIKDLISQVIPVISDVAYNYNLLPPAYLAAEFLENDSFDAFIPLPMNVSTKDNKIEIETQLYFINNSEGASGDGNNIGYGFWYTGNYLLTAPGVSKAFGTYPKKEWVNFKVTVENLKISLLADDGELYEFNMSGNTTEKTHYLWRASETSRMMIARRKKHSFKVNGEYLYDLIPAIDEQGIPCMFDKVSEQAFHNSGTGQFIVGMTMKQARKLGKLPTGGGSLTISLPNNYSEDTLITNAIADATSNGWILTIQTYTSVNSASGASTFGMPRIWVRKVQTENGSYVDNENIRYQVEWCVAMYTPDNSTPDQYGYEMFRNVETAIEYWGLSQWVDPEMENITEQIL